MYNSFLLYIIFITIYSLMPSDKEEYSKIFERRLGKESDTSRGCDRRTRRDLTSGWVVSGNQSSRQSLYIGLINRLIVMLIIGAKLERVRPMGRGGESLWRSTALGNFHSSHTAQRVKSRMNIRSLIRGKHPTLIKRLVKPIFFNSTRPRTSIVASQS